MTPAKSLPREANETSPHFVIPRNRDEESLFL
jgi:hypothetical protein